MINMVFSQIVNLPSPAKGLWALEAPVERPKGFTTELPRHVKARQYYYRRWTLSIQMHSYLNRVASV